MQRPTVVDLTTGAPYDVYIGRAKGERGKWGNPFVITPHASRDQVVAQYRAYLLGKPELLAQLPELAGKRLGCYCAPLPCHGDVLAELVAALPEAA